MWTSAMIDWDEVAKTAMMMWDGVLETLFMTLLSTLFGYILGLPIGITLAVTGNSGIRPNAKVYKVLDVIANIIRSVPFLILLILIMPLTRLIVGRSYGTAATVVPLTVAAAPFIGRMIESSLNEVDRGVVEAAQSMGASTANIIIRVLLVEARTSIMVGVTIALGTILGYSAMAGIVGGGGLGDIAMRYGYYRYESEIMFVSVVLLVILVQIFQTIGMKMSVKLDRRKR